jgi:hypothetical protein
MAMVPVQASGLQYHGVAKIYIFIEQLEERVLYGTIRGMVSAGNPQHIFCVRVIFVLAPPGMFIDRNSWVHWQHVANMLPTFPAKVQVIETNMVISSELVTML